MTAEAAFSCHAEASAGSPCEVRVVKKETEEAAQFSADSQLTGRTCFFHAGGREEPAVTFVIKFLFKRFDGFLFRSFTETQRARWYKRRGN